VGATIRVQPDPVGALYVDAFQTSAQQVTVYWSPLVFGVATGNSEIYSYNLQFD
jgi:hypothetical protein